MNASRFKTVFVFTLASVCVLSAKLRRVFAVPPCFALCRAVAVPLLVGAFAVRFYALFCLAVALPLKVCLRIACAFPPLCQNVNR